MNAFRLGAFIVCGLAVLTAGIFLIGNRKFAFRSTYTVKAQYDNSGGLVEGADVRVGGIHMGTVRTISLPKTPDGKVTVWMDLQSKTRDVVRKDSVAAIQSEGLLGDEYVEVSFGSNDGAAIQNGDTIAGQGALEMAQLFNKTNGILDEVQSSVNNLQAITGKINNGTGTVGALINDKSLYNKVDSDAEALQHNFLLRGFFKNRGYDDPAELTKNAIPKLPSQAYSKEFTLDGKTLFEKPDTAKLKDEKALKPVGEFLQNNRFGLVVVAVLGSPKGDTSQEQQLTLARAAVVRDYLVNNFRLDDTRIKTIGLAKQSDIAQGEVEVMVYPPSSSR